MDYAGYLFISLGITSLATVYLIEKCAGMMSQRRIRKQLKDDGI